MTQSSADKFANVVMGAAVLGATYYVLRTPPLRRLVWGLTLATVTGIIPAWITQEIRASWEASAAPAVPDSSRVRQARAG
jgi:hypothetical protein